MTRTSMTRLVPWKDVLVCFDCYKYAIYHITYKQWIFIIVLEFGQVISNVWWRLTSWFINHILSIEFTHGRSSKSLPWGKLSFIRKLFHSWGLHPCSFITSQTPHLQIPLLKEFCFYTFSLPSLQILRPQERGNLYKTITILVDNSVINFLIYIQSFWKKIFSNGQRTKLYHWAQSQ